VSDVPIVSKQEAEESSLAEALRDELWQMTWSAVTEAAAFDCPSYPLALHIAQQLSQLYASASDGEFRYSANIRALLDASVLLCRPRVPLDIQSAYMGGDDTSDTSQQSSMPPAAVMLRISGANGDKVAEMQLQRAVLSLLKKVVPVDTVAFLSLVSSLAEVLFAVRTVLIDTRFSAEPVLLGPCPEKLRAEAGEYLLAILGKANPVPVPVLSSETSTSTAANAPPPPAPVAIPKGISTGLLDVILRRFLYDICKSAVDVRCSRSSSSFSHSIDFNPLSDSRPVTKGAQNSSSSSSRTSFLAENSNSSNSSGGVSQFFSSIGRMLSTDIHGSSGGSPQAAIGTATATPSTAAPKMPAPTTSPSALNKMRQHLVGTGNSQKNGGAISASAIATASSASDVQRSVSMAAWKPLFFLRTEFDVVATAIRRCLQLAEDEGAAVSEALGARVVLCLGCSLSPWAPEEVLSSLDATPLSPVAKDNASLEAVMEALFSRVAYKSVNMRYARYFLFMISLLL
jgi:hypothetical protein